MRGVVVALGALGLLASCDSAAVFDCGFDGAHRSVAGAHYCLFGDDVLSDASFDCPSGAPNIVRLERSVVCTSQEAARPESLPASVCRELDEPCVDRPGPADAAPPAEDAGDAGEADASTPELDASIPSDDDAGPHDMGSTLLDAEPPGDSASPTDVGPRDAGLDARVASDLGVDAGAHGSDGSTADGASADGGAGCPALLDRPLDMVGSISGSVTWTCDRRYYLTSDIVVPAGSDLTITQGTVVYAADGITLSFAAGATLHAEGAPGAPVVFTTAAGTYWTGLVVRGPDCGTLRYLRIDSTTVAGTALELHDCGTETIIEHLRVRASGSGLLLEGGRADLRWVFLERGRAPLTVDGWSGRMQYLAIRANLFYDDRVGLLVLDGTPTFFNVSLIGTDLSPGTAIAMTGGRARIVNALLGQFDRGTVDIRSVALASSLSADIRHTSVERALVFEMGTTGTNWFGVDEMADDDLGFDESAHFMRAEWMNRFGEDPMRDELRTPAGGPTSLGAEAPPDDGFFDPTATFIGAVEPGGEDWTTATDGP